MVDNSLITCILLGEEERRFSVLEISTYVTMSFTFCQQNTQGVYTETAKSLVSQKPRYLSDTTVTLISRGLRGGRYAGASD